MEYLIPIQIEVLEEGGYLATSKVFPALLTQGRTIAETIEIAQDVARRLIESYIEHGDLVPQTWDYLASKMPIEVKIPVPEVA